MSNETCNVEEERKCWVLEAAKSFGGDLKSSDLCDHLRNMNREALLAVRSVLDVCIDQLGKKKEPTAGDQAEARKIPVE